MTTATPSSADFQPPEQSPPSEGSGFVAPEADSLQGEEQSWNRKWQRVRSVPTSWR